jgi:formyltetrahydrofolate deformylase
MPTAVLLLSCRDQPGLVHAVAEFVLAEHGNIVHAEQHIDQGSGVFFQRVEFELPTADLDIERIEAAFAPTAERFGMAVQVRRSDDRPRVALLASTQPHCLADLLARWRSGELPAEIVAVISNHADHAGLAEFHGVPHHHLPVTPETREAQEGQVLDVLRAHDVELVVLARYMQILSGDFLGAVGAPVINIHHSFLPAFAGSSPYHQALERGVKIIGATSHYVTEVLDDGPIIEQDVEHVTHRDDVDDLLRIGRDIERVVLARAVKWHLEDRVLVDGRRTVVFR